MSAYRTAAPAKPLPARCAIRFDELPHAAQEHLRDVSAVEHSTAKRERHTRLYAILATTAGLFVLVGATLWSQAATSVGEKLLFDRRMPWDADEITIVTVACFLVGVFFLGGIAALVRQRNAPLGTFWYAHRAYLLDCAHDRVVAYPLALLDDPDVVGETVQISFGDIDVQIAFDLPAEAVAFLVPVRKHATAAAACLARGAREEIPGSDFLPDALLYRESPRFPLDRAWALPLVAGLLLALVGRVVLPGLHASVAEARFVRACQQWPEFCSKYQIAYPGGAHLDQMDDAFFEWTSGANRYGAYKAAFPRGRHLRAATVAAASKGTEALELYRKRAPAAKEQGNPRLVDAMLTTLEVLRDMNTTTLPLRFTGNVDENISRWNQPLDHHGTKGEVISNPEIAGLDPFAKVSAIEAVRTALVGAVGVAGALEIREIENTDRTDDAQAELTVAYRIFEGERVFRDANSKKGPYAEIDIDWTFTFRWPGNPALGEVSVTLHTVPASTFSTFVGTADRVYAGMAQDEAKSLGPALRQALGLVPAPSPTPN